MMKTFIPLCLLILTTAAQAQLLAPVAMHEMRPNAADGTERVTTIWSEDFANAITAGWENTDTSGVAAWEYRGPNTTPNNTVGSRGLCTDANGIGNVIVSPTWNNGYVIFDSNWWDNPNLPCTLDNFGTGPAPAPHLATLTSPAIDLSAHMNVALRFNQYVRNYQALMKVEVSANNSPWAVVFDNSTTPLQSDNDMSVQIPISNIAGGQANVKIRFVFEGSYYFWQLDDISIVEIFANDLATRSTTYGDFDFYDLSHPTGFELMEYTKYPDEMAPLLKFATQCDNVGSTAQINCRLNVEVVNLATNTIIHTAQSNEGFNLQPGSSIELRASDYQMPATQANYHINYFTSQNAVDENDVNNLDTLGFQITDCTYARDFNFTNSTFSPGPDLALLDYEVGNIFLVTAPNQSCYSISAAIAAGTSLPTTLYARLYEFDAQESIVAAELGTTATISITNSMFNSYGQGNFVHLLFDNPLPVQSGHAYLAVVGSTDGADNVIIAFSGASNEFTSWVHFMPDQWFYLTGTPMVRMNFGTNISVEENEMSNANLLVYPNPAQNNISIDIAEYKNEALDIDVLDYSGKIILSNALHQSHADTQEIDIADLTSGMYMVRISSQTLSTTKRFIKM
jgi:hypothetical protein